MRALTGRPDKTEALHFLVIDLDGFKAINDTLGHQAGDRILRTFAAHARSHARCEDLIARLGGDEFVLILHGCTQAQAIQMAEGIVSTLWTMPVEGACRIGASIGVTEFHANDTLDAVYARADAALYQAKADGKGVVREWRRIAAG